MIDTQKMPPISVVAPFGSGRVSGSRQRAVTPAATPFTTTADRQREFANLLGRASSTEVGNAAEHQKAARQKEAAQDMVAIALVQPILKGLRDGNHAAAPFGPGPAEKQFGGFVDAQWSRALVRGGNFPLVKAVQRWMGEREPPVAAPISPSVSSPRRVTN